MTASSTVVIQNLAYLVGAIVLAIVIGLVVWLRHRPPRSVESNVESFHRGLRALAPDDRRPVSRPVGLRIQPPAASAPEPPEEPQTPEDLEPQPVQADAGTEDGEHVDLSDGSKPEAGSSAEPGVDPADADEAGPAEEAEVQPDASAEVVDLPKREADGAATGEAAGDWAGVETG